MGVSNVYFYALSPKLVNTPHYNIRIFQKIEFSRPQGFSRKNSISQRPYEKEKYYFRTYAEKHIRNNCVYVEFLSLENWIFPGKPNFSVKMRKVNFPENPDEVTKNS